MPTQAALDLYEILRPLAYADSANGFALMALCEAAADSLQEVYDYSREEVVTQSSVIDTVVVNMVPNPDPEIDLSYWGLSNSGGGAALVRSSDQAEIGSFSLKVTNTNAGQNDFAFPGASGLPIAIPIVAGVKYLFRGRYRCTAFTAGATNNYGPRLVFWNNNTSTAAIPVEGDTFVTITGTTPGWSYFSLSGTAPAGATHAYFRLYAPQGTVYYEAILLNEFYSIHNLPNINGYVSGADGSPYKWEGIAYQSRTLKDVIFDRAIVTPAWSKVTDVDRAPAEALPWLAQLVGQVLPPQQTGESDATYEARIREFIRDTPAFYRGSVAAMTTAAQQYLTGTKTVYFRERDTTAWHLTISTRRLETPVEDWDATNLATNGSAETNLTNITSSNATIARVNTPSPAKYGSWFVQSTVTGLGSKVEQSATVSGATLGRTWTASVWVRGIGSTIGKQMFISIMEFGGASGAATTNGPTIILTADWQLVKATRTFTANDRTGVAISALGPVGEVIGDIWHLDGFQIEENPDASPFIHTDGSTASRPAGQGPVGTALRAAKPAGLILAYTVVTGWDYAALDAAFASYTALDAAFTTYIDLEEGP